MVPALLMKLAPPSRCTTPAAEILSVFPARLYSFPLLIFSAPAVQLIVPALVSWR
jgi:hypothetical protein